MAMAAPSRAERAASDTVTIACKLQMGVQAYLEEEKEVTEAVVGGGLRTRTQWFRTDEPFVNIKGPGRATDGSDPDSSIADGYALTFGISREWAEKWFEQNKTWKPVKDGLVKYADNRHELKAMTKEHATQRTGLEPIAQKGDPRVKMIGGSVGPRTND
jgi:hypothetical protein